MTGRAFAAILAVLAAAPLGAQVANDGCAGALPLVEGIAVTASSAGATTGPEPVACNAGNDVWFWFVASCTAQYVVSTCSAATGFDTVVSVWNAASGCGALTVLACNDDNCAIPGQATTSRVTFTATAGAAYAVSVGGKNGAFGSFTLAVSQIVVTTLAFFDAGPGSLGYYVTGPPGGVYFVGMTIAPGAFPFGWFYGLDIPLSDLVAQSAFGPPFTGAFSPCGTATFGPLFGVPSGLTVHAVALGFAPGATVPGYFSNPAVGVAP